MINEPVEIEEKEPSIPRSILAKLYDATGTKEGSMKGFALFFIDEDGEPYYMSQYENSATSLALEKVMEKMMQADFDA
jgi:hypothetical protein